eukprot:3184186-Pyramimonas_sp.AAC.1
MAPGGQTTQVALGMPQIEQIEQIETATLVPSRRPRMCGPELESRWTSSSCPTVVVLNRDGLVRPVQLFDSTKAKNGRGGTRHRFKCPPGKTTE